MRDKVPSLIFVMILAFAFRCVAQESLLIGSGDAVHITVYEAPDLDQHVKIPDSGEVKLILGGTVSILGDSPTVAARKIEDRLRRANYLLDPHATLFVEHYGTQTVSIFGQVRVPGSYAVDTNRSLIEVLSLAGGFNDLADRHVTISHKDSKQTSVFFVSNKAEAALTDQPTIHPGDTVYVAKADVVYLLGDVNKPGGYANVTNDARLTVLQAISLAGGTPPTAVPSRAKWIHREPDGHFTTVDVDVSAMQKGKVADVVLSSNDIVYIPYSYLKNIAVNISQLIAAASAAAVYQF